MSRLAPLVGLVLMATACSGGNRILVNGDLAGAVAAARPGAVLELAAGTYTGPISIDKPLTVTGGPGVTITGPTGQAVIEITSDDVTLREIQVVGGDSGIEVLDAEGVELIDIDIRGAQWHGIFAHDAQITVRDCIISELGGDLPQGIEVTNSDQRPPSHVEGCQINGPVFEGLVSHVSSVLFVNNHVRDSRERGIVITEMSTGRMEGNRVDDAVGSAYFCGDMSLCSVVDNVAQGVADSGVDFRSTGGHGLVVHFHSQAFVDGLTVKGAAGEDVLVMLESELVTESLYP